MSMINFNCLSVTGLRSGGYPTRDTGLSRLLLMLSGGTVTTGPAGSGVPRLELPPSGAAGGLWFDCVRGLRG
jgi:hypothetical protein